MSLKDIRIFPINGELSSVAANKGENIISYEVNYPTEIYAIGGIPDWDLINARSNSDYIELGTSRKVLTAFKFNHSGLNQIPDFNVLSKQPPLMLGKPMTRDSLTLKLKPHDVLQVKLYAGANAITDAARITCMAVEYRTKEALAKIMGITPDDFDTLPGSLRQSKPERLFWNSWVTNKANTVVNQFYELDKGFGGMSYLIGARMIPINVRYIIKKIGVQPHANHLYTDLMIGTEKFPSDEYPFITAPYKNMLPFGDDGDEAPAFELGTFQIDATNEVMVLRAKDRGVLIGADGVNAYVQGEQITT